MNEFTLKDSKPGVLVKSLIQRLWLIHLAKDGDPRFIEEFAVAMSGMHVALKEVVAHFDEPSLPFTIAFNQKGFVLSHFGGPLPLSSPMFRDFPTVYHCTFTPGKIHATLAN